MTNSCLYRNQVYLNELHREHIAFLREGFTSYLTIPNPKNHLYYPAQLSQRAEHRIISQLMPKEDKKQDEFLFLIVALKLAGQSYHVELSQFKKQFPNISHSDKIEKYVEYYSKIPPHVIANKNKQSIRWQYQKLLGKANSEGYFTIQDVPVFLISTNWLQQLYSNDERTPSPINNQTLLEPVQFPLAQEKYMHYNYRLKEELRENNDYKLVPYQAWKHLYNIYGGFELRRFTTKEREPIVQVWLIKVTILIVEDRCAFHHLQLQVSKNDSITQLMERVRLTLKKYKIVPQKYLQRNIGLYKSRQMDVNELVSIIQDDSQPCIVNHRFENITDFSLEIDQAGILTPHDILILNLSRQKGIFSKVPPLKTLSTRERCLNCGSSDDLQPCKCKTVFFCSQKCKDNQKSHIKDCNSVVAQTQKFNLVVDYYRVKNRNHPDLKKIQEIGKVGFENLGNTCYMNAALQCLLRLPNLSQFFLSNGHLKDLNVSNVLGSGGHMACAYGQLVKSFYTTNKRALEPSQILRCISKNPQFRGHNHQDSQQFLNYFLDKLHEDLNKIKVKPYTEQVESDGRPDEIVSRLSWQNYKKRNDSFISDLLAGQYRSQIRCPDCNRLSITFDPFLSVTLQFPKPQKGEMLQGFYMNEQGEFQKVNVELKLAMNTSQFYQKYFGHPIKSIYIKEKRITDIWDETKSVFQNKKSAGLLFFFDQPTECPIQIVIEFHSTEGKNALQYYSRIVYTKQLKSQSQLIKLVLLAIKKPFQKVIQKDISQSQYLELCVSRQVVKIKSLVEQENAVQYPITGCRKLTARVELHYKKVTSVVPKLNTTSGSFEGLVPSLVKKLKGQLTVRQLLDCFTSPQKLTEENAWYCSVCKGHKLAEKAMSLYALPEYLIVHLKRFNHRGDSGNRYIIYGQKVTTPIALEEFQEIQGKKYQLLGVVNHFGSLVHGHYTACVKRDDWHNYDDSRCYKSKLDGKNAYLLFYKRVQ